MGRVSANRLMLLRAEIASDLVAIDRIEAAVGTAMFPIATDGAPPEVVCRGLALYLHDFYQAVEQILVRIAKTLNGFDTLGEAWHTDLLRLASIDVEGLRPAIVSSRTMRELDEYRAFRCFVRHAYDREFIWNRMQRLVENLPEVVASFRDDITSFTNVLTQMIQEIENEQD